MADEHAGWRLEPRPVEWAVKVGNVRMTPRASSDMKVQCGNCEPKIYLAQIRKRDANADLDPEQIIPCLLKLVTLGDEERVSCIRTVERVSKSRGSTLHPNEACAHEPGSR